MKYAAISLYTGAGGMDFGLEKAQFETTVAVEMNATCCKTLRHNRPDWHVIEAPIESVSSAEILKKSGLKRREADLLIGGPPCQPFSKSGYWATGDAKRLKDPRSNTLMEYMRVLEDTLPKTFILENVYGLAYKGKDEGMVYLKKRIEQINRRHGTKYSFNWKVLNAADYGVPQIRERIFIVGSRDGLIFDFPLPRYCDPSDEEGSKAGLKPHLTAWDALHDIQDPKETALPSKVGGRWGALVPSIPEGSNYLFHSERGEGKPIFKWRSRYWNFLLKLAKDRPSWTIQAQPGPAIGPFHWNNRRLTMRELARLQTFPDDVEILGEATSVQKQLGNAVPSAIGELLGYEIRRQFFGEKVSSKKLKLIPSKTTTNSKATKRFPVRREYLESM